MKHWLHITALCGLVAFNAPAQHTTARLVLPVETAAPGDSLLAGIVLEMEEGWHTYWRNPGEAGMATEIQWSLPDGVEAGEIQWPIPEPYEADGLVTFVYHDQVTLLVPLTFSLRRSNFLRLTSRPKQGPRPSLVRLRT